MTFDLQDPSPQTLGTLKDGLGLAPGQPAPDVTVEDDQGRPVRLATLWREGPVLLVFYRGGWCPYCNVQIHSLAEADPTFRAKGVRLAAISVDRPAAAAKTKATYTITFPLLSDPDLVAHEAFGVVHHASAEEAAKLKGFGLDIEASSGRTHHKFAVPSIFVIDRRGVIRWAHADPDYKTRPSTAQLLKVVDSLTLSGR